MNHNNNNDHRSSRAAEMRQRRAAAAVEERRTDESRSPGDFDRNRRESLQGSATENQTTAVTVVFVGGESVVDLDRPGPR